MKLAAKIIIILLLLVVLLAAGAYGILQTGFGRQKIVELVNGSLKSPDSAITISGLGGSLPFSPRLDQVLIADKNGVWLKVSGIKLDWSFTTSPLSFYVENVEAAKIDVLREPESEEKDDEPMQFKLPELPRVVVKRISLPQINVAESFTGQKQVIVVKGSVRTFYDSASDVSRLEISSVEGTPLDVKLAIAQDNFEVIVDEDAGGVVGKLAQINPEESFSVKVTGRGIFPSGKGEAVVKTSAADVLVGRYEIKGSDKELALDLNAVLNLPDTEAYDEPRKMAGDEVALDVSFVAKNDGSINIHKARVDSANIKLEVDGSYSKSIVALNYSANIIDLTPIADKPGFLNLQGKAEGKDGNIAVTGQAEGDFAEFKSLLLGYDVIGKDGLWKINQFGVDTADVNLTLDGDVDVSSKKLALDFVGNVNDLKKFSGNVGGAVAAKGSARGNFEDVDFDISAQASKLSGLPEQVAGLVGNKITLLAKGAAGTAGNVKLDEFSLTGSNITAMGSAEVDDKRVKADFSASIPDTTKVEPSLKGSLVANVKVDGTADAAAGKFDATLTSGGQKMEASSSFALSGDVLKLKDISAKTKGILVRGDAEVNTKTSLADSKLEIDAADLRGLQAFLAQKISGRGKALVVASSKNKMQAIDANGNFQSIAVDDLKIESTSFKAKSSDIKNLAGLEAEVVAANIVSGENMVENFKFSASGKQALVDWKLDANMSKPEVAKISAAGSMAANMPDWELKLNNLDANYAAYVAKLNAPATIKQKAGLIDVANLVLNLNDANVSIKGQYSAAKVDLKVAAADVRLGKFTDGKFRGRADADVAITGSAAKPNAKLSAKVDRISTQDTGQIPLSVKADATIGDGKLVATVQALQDSGHVTANAELPVKFALEPFVFELAGNSPLTGGAVVDLKLADIANILLPSDQLLRGELKGNVSFAGTLENPTGSGQINLSNARYENFSTGTLLENMQAAISTDGKTVILSGFNAKAGGGSLSASGSAGLAEPYAVKAAVALKDAELVNMQTASGKINGQVDLAGNAKEQLVTGKIVLGPMEINIPEQSNVSVAEVKILNPEVLPRQKWQKVESNEPKVPSVMKLDIEVDAPSQVFVRGRGLETEMRGTLKVTGTSTTPEIRGQLYTVRGTYKFLDRDLELKECVLDFRGSIPPSPYLNIVADTDTNDITVGIKLTGSVNEPKLSLTSNPQLPEDEVLAHLLFGRDIKSITPIQGAQLVQALNSLRGGGGVGFDPVGEMRKAVGVDKLDVDADEAGNVTVGAGKYVTDKVYLGVEGGAGEGSGKVKAEIEATKSISIEAESGAASNGVRLNWKYDY